MPTIVQSASNGDGTGLHPFSVTLGATPTEGNLLLAVFSSSPAAGLLTWSGGYEQLDVQTVGWPSGGNMYLFQKIAGAGESPVITWDGLNGSRQTGALVEIAEGTLESYPFLLADVAGATSQAIGPVIPADSSLPYLLLFFQIVGHAQALSTLDANYSSLIDVVGNSGGSSNRLIAATRSLAVVDGVTSYDGTNVYASAVRAGTWHIALSGVDPYDGVGTIATGWAG